MVMTIENSPHIELVDSLREQLKLQQAINCQFEVDLEARDELVSMLQTQLRHSEEAISRHSVELGQRRAMMKALAHTVAGLEKLCHNLEDELERSREESRIRFEITPTESEQSQNSDHMVENSRLVFAEEQIEELARRLETKEAELELLDQERQYASEEISRFKELLHKRDTELEQKQIYIVEKEREAEELRTQASSIVREHARAMDEQKRLYNDLEQREIMTRSQMENTIKAKAEAEVTVHSLQQQTSRLTNEIQLLRKQVHDLQQGSADKEVKIVQLNKLHQQDQEDKAGLNLALDSKQQELELIKRKLGVRSTGGGGATPAYSRTVTKESSNRRGSLGFTTPLPRPSSAIGISHVSQVTSTPLKNEKGKPNEDTSNQSTVKPKNRTGLSVNRPSLDSPVDSPHHSTSRPPHPSRYLKSVNGTPSTSTSRVSHHRRSSVTSNSSIASASGKENSRQSRPNSRLSIPA